MKVIFADGTNKEFLDSTSIYPSDSPYIPSAMEVQMDYEQMSLATFEKWMLNTEKTKEMTFERAINENDVMTEVFYGYTRMTECGRKALYNKDVHTGEVVSQWVLYARLEQVV